MAAIDRKNPAGITSNPAYFMTLAFHWPRNVLDSPGQGPRGSGNCPKMKDQLPEMQVRSEKEDVEL
jgi:hypothetical protein